MICFVDSAIHLIYRLGRHSSPLTRSRVRTLASRRPFEAQLWCNPGRADYSDGRLILDNPPHLTRIGRRQHGLGLLGLGNVTP